jgi:hypothetical protein
MRFSNSQFPIYNFHFSIPTLPRSPNSFALIRYSARFMTTIQDWSKHSWRLKPRVWQTTWSVYVWTMGPHQLQKVKQFFKGGIDWCALIFVGAHKSGILLVFKTG